MSLSPSGHGLLAPSPIHSPWHHVNPCAHGQLPGKQFHSPQDTLCSPPRTKPPLPCGCEHGLGLGTAPGETEAAAGTGMAAPSCAPGPWEQPRSGVGAGSSHGASQEPGTELAPTASSPQDPGIPGSGTQGLLQPAAAGPRHPLTKSGSSTLDPHCWRPFPTRKSQSHRSSLAGD